ncbi:hypothetical protein ES332_A07G150100v1 [Gossypium tomentosum]|uniref:Uncharacterized protein n=1 Tax=Gossypium tomentosum TaxID=34277 RepID=A0A5D2PVM6_GOSTO|nr:hypothetical protein ES332_A07G150100v1 [Gossypium tomentosum]
MGIVWFGEKIKVFKYWYFITEGVCVQWGSSKMLLQEVSSKTHFIERFKSGEEILWMFRFSGRWLWFFQVVR